MKRTISLPLKPFSVNAMFCRNRAFKTRAFNDWSAAIFHKLDTEQNLQSMTDLREFFDPKKHSYIVDLKFHYPSKILYTKAGGLSARAHDISNIEKPLIDLIFLPNFFNKSSPYGCQNLNIDDKYISKMSSEKLAGETHLIEAVISIQCI